MTKRKILLQMLCGSRPTILFTVMLTLAAPAHTAQAQDQQKKITPSERSQSRRTKKIVTSERPAETEALVANARSAPAEFAAEALIRIAESLKAVDREWKLELLEEAFQRATDAQYPVRRTSLGGKVDTRSGYLSYAYDLRLDALSLRCRVVEAMLSVDKNRAQALFSEIPPMRLGPLDCDDALVYDVKEFYELLAEIVNKTFSPEEMRQNQHIEFLNSYILGITSSSQLGPVAQAIVAVKPTSSQLSLLVCSFGNALKRITTDDRSFSYATTGQFARSVVSLIELCRKMDVASSALIKAYRGYLVSKLSGVRCADNLSGGVRDYMQKMVEYLNSSLWPEIPISEEESKPARVLGRAQIFEYWTTPQAKKILMGIKSLRFGSGTTPLADAEKETPGWRTELADFLNTLDDWDAKTEETEADYFHQKSNMFAALVAIVPAGAARDDVVVRFIGFLRENYIQRKSRIEWLLKAKQLLDIAHRENRSNVLEILNNSGDANLRLYASLTKLTPSSKQGSR